MSYNARGLATDIVHNGGESQVAYDPAGGEYQEVDTWSGSSNTETTTFLAGGLFRIVRDSNNPGTVTFREALAVDGASSASM